MRWVIKVKGRWAYRYCVVDHEGAIDCYRLPTRSVKAATRFLGKALKGCKNWERPSVIDTDITTSYEAAIGTLKREDRCPADLVHWQVQYLNNVIAADHGKFKRQIKSTLRFQSLKTAYATRKGFEVMRALKKQQARAFPIQDSIRGEVRLV